MCPICDGILYSLQFIVQFYVSKCDFKSHNCDSIPLCYYLFIYYLNAKTQAMHHFIFYFIFYLYSLDHDFSSVSSWYSDVFSVIESQVVTEDTFY